MHAIEVSQTGGPEVLSYVERPQPEPGHGELVIKAEAIGVNFIDTYFRSGSYPRELPFVIGSEVCGTVVALGPGATAADAGGIAVGDRVVGASANGGYAEFCTAPAALTAKVPDGVSAEVAASALLKGLTAHYLLKSVYPVADGDAILVHAGAGGVGLILTQWATHLGARVISTVSTPEKAKLPRDAGAAEVLDYPTDAWQFGGQVRALTDGAGVAAVYDGVGATTFDASLASLAVRGTLALFGAASGPVPPVEPQRLNAAGSVYLTRPSLFHFIRTAEEFSWRASELFDAISSGVITIEVGGRYRLADAMKAHQDLEARKTIGSVVLLP
ncbi:MULTISPECIES: quinone oxidoreductase family protein [Mycobacterium]|uniref:quinone oxidoreductase family protein n=1 Tax=Mycobacterium TaxID=1763 RepID=UPI000358927C|nr:MULTISPECIES: quinone oxidoreductase [Mycobacterium]EPQ48157.1 Quinone oxidoreductase [Mycobacterium sp. 012931]RFZ68683.1 Quinone oxidoreductase 1 [Mycobacterium marinum]BEH76438.1 quinone reductase [Mycobacterium pseudoshottsii]GAQ39891.1 quinone oxidoreductase [Mycobacterium pseudoshottsii JCM 15466]